VSTNDENKLTKYPNHKWVTGPSIEEQILQGKNKLDRELIKKDKIITDALQLLIKSHQFDNASMDEYLLYISTLQKTNREIELLNYELKEINAKLTEEEKVSKNAEITSKNAEITSKREHILKLDQSNTSYKLTKSILTMTRDDIIRIANSTKGNFDNFLQEIVKLNSPGEYFKYASKDIGPTGQLQLLSTEFDQWNEKLEALNTYLLAITVASASSVVGLPVAAPVAALCIFSRIISASVGQFLKADELSYICSACLGFTMANMGNFAKMLKFYTRDDVKEAIANNTITQNPTWNTHPEHLWKFLIFLVQQIDFEAKLGPLQFMFWNAFLKLFDFSIDNPDINKPFRYLRKFCVYDEKKKTMFAFNSNKMGLQDNTQFCNNYNDILMRVMEYKLLKLHKYYEQRDAYKGFTKKTVDSYRNDKYYFPGSFENFYGTLSNIKKQIDGRNSSEKSDASQVVSDKTLGEIDTSKTHKTGGSKTIHRSRQLKNKHKTQKRNIKNDQTGGGLLNRTMVALFAPNKRYNEMLREYVIITGNTSVLLSEYVLHTNEFQDKKVTELEKILKGSVEVNKKLDAEVNANREVSPEKAKFLNFFKAELDQLTAKLNELKTPIYVLEQKVLSEINSEQLNNAQL
jgi:hypothetical protein